MANVCTTTYTLSGKEEAIAKISEAMDGIKALAVSKSKDDPVLGIWLGYILEYLGMDESEIKKKCIPCRGSIDFMDVSSDGTEMTIDTETAWEPMPEPIKMLCDSVAPEEIAIVYTATEPGCGLFCTNDPANADTYVVYAHEPDLLPEPLQDMEGDFVHISELTERLLKALQKERLACSIEYLIEDAIFRWGEYLSINRMKTVDL